MIKSKLLQIIVFIHGVGLDHEMWYQVKSFKNNSILVYDLLGHGKTPLIKKNVNKIFQTN